MADMRKGFAVALLLLLGCAGQAAAADTVDVPRALCPVRATGEDAASFDARAYDHCETLWRDLLALNRAGGQTHDQFIRRCARKCGADVIDHAAGHGVDRAAAFIPPLAVEGGIVGGAAAAMDSGQAPPASP
jgi:hypothetical protein